MPGLSHPWSACTAPARRLTLRAAPAPSYAHVPHPHAAGAEGGLRRCGQRRCAPSPRPAARLCVSSARCCRRSHVSASTRRWGARARGHLYDKRPMDRQRCTECDDGAPDQCPAPGKRAARRRPWRLRQRGRPGGRSKGLALAARGLWPRAARAAHARGPPSARGAYAAYGGPLRTRWSAARGRAPLGRTTAVGAARLSIGWVSGCS